MSEANKKVGVSGLRILVTVAWVLAVGAVVYLLYDEDMLRSSGDSIGVLTVADGKVRIQPEQSILWFDASQGQKIASGDKVATGTKSRAIVHVNSDRRIDLGPNSMVALMDESDTEGKPTLSLTLLRGRVDASIVKNGDGSSGTGFLGRLLGEAAGPDEVMKIESGGRVLVIEGEGQLNEEATGALEDEEYVANEAPSEGLTISLAVPTSEVQPELPKPTPALAVLSQPVIPRPEPTPLPVPVPSPPRLEEKKLTPVELAPPKKSKGPREPKPGMLPRFLSTMPRQLATPLGLASGCQGRLSIVVEPPRTAPIKGWTPIVRIHLKGQSNPTIQLEGKPRFRRQTLKADMRQICALAAGGLQGTVDLTLKTAVRLEVAGPELESTVTRSLQLMSLAELPDRPVSLQLRRTDSDFSEVAGWLPVTKGFAKRAEFHVLRLRSSKLLPRLFPIFKKNGLVAFGQASPRDFEREIHLATSSGRILGTFWTNSNGVGVVRQIAEVLRADVAFSGMPEALVTLPTTQLNRLSMLEAMVRSGDEVTVISRQRAVRINQASVEVNPASVRAMGIEATVALRGDVQVVLP